jgi:hypothetical protein
MDAVASDDQVKLDLPAATERHQACWSVDATASTRAPVQRSRPKRLRQIPQQIRAMQQIITRAVFRLGLVHGRTPQLAPIVPIPHDDRSGLIARFFSCGSSPSARRTLVEFGATWMPGADLFQFIRLFENCAPRSHATAKARAAVNPPMPAPISAMRFFPLMLAILVRQRHCRRVRVSSRLGGNAAASARPAPAIVRPSATWSLPSGVLSRLLVHAQAVRRTLIVLHRQRNDRDLVLDDDGVPLAARAPEIDLGSAVAVICRMGTRFRPANRISIEAQFVSRRGSPDRKRGLERRTEATGARPE